METPRKFITASARCRNGDVHDWTSLTFLIPHFYLCSNKFTWYFIKQKYYMFYHYAKIQRTYSITILLKNLSIFPIGISPKRISPIHFKCFVLLCSCFKIKCEIDGFRTVLLTKSSDIWYGCFVRNSKFFFTSILSVFIATFLRTIYILVRMFPSCAAVSLLYLL